MASTKFINECKNGANSNRLGKISVETIKKVSGTKLELSKTLDKKISPKLYGITKQETTTGKNLLNVPSEYSVTGLKRVNMNMPIGSYVINWDDIITDGTSTSMLIYFYYEDNTTLSKYISPTYTSKSLSFTTTKNVKKVGIYSQENYDNSQGITTTFKKLMISTDGGTYEPYTGGQPSPSPDYPQEIEVATGSVSVKSTGKNLFDSEDWYTTLNNIKTESMMKEVVDNIEYYKFRPDAIYNHQYMIGKFKENTQYILTCKARQYENTGHYSTGFTFHYTDGTSTSVFINKTTTEYDYKIVSDIGKTISYIRLDYAYNEYVLVRDIQLLEGSVATDYEPYKESSITYNLGDNFLADKDYIENGVLNKNIGKVVLNGSESGWKPFLDSNGHYNYYINNPLIAKNVDKCWCNQFIYQGVRGNNMAGEFSIGGYNPNKNGNIVFNPSNDTTNKLSDFLTKIASNPLEVYFPLETPEQIQLETTGELRTFEPNTIITNSLDSEMEVEYSSWDTEMTNSDNLTDVSVEDSCYVDGQIIGTTYAKKATSQLIAIPNDVDLLDKKIKVEIGVKYADLSNEMIKMGNYTIERPKDEQTENFTQITAYDDFNLLDNPYVCNLDFSNDITIADFYIDVCNQLKLSPMKTIFLNSDIKVTANPFVNKETLRVVLQEIEKVSCTFSEIDHETNKIDLVWLSENEEPDYEFATSDYTTLEGGKITYGPVNCLVIKESQIEGENTVRQDDDSIKTNGETQIAIQDSYFLFTQALREQAIDNIWNRVKGLTYVDCKLTTSYGKPFLKVGKKIRVNVNDGRVFDTYVLKHTFKYDGTFESIIESPALTKQETKVKSKSISESIRLTEIRVDKAEGKITATTQKIQEVETDIKDNYYSKTNVNELIQTAETGVTNTFSEAGGNNILRNTGLWFESNDTDNPYEFWLGNVKKGKNDNAVGYNSMLLQNGTLEQEQEVPNGDYSISFYYQKLNQLCNASVVINDVEYPLESMEVKQFYTGEKDNETGEYIVQPIVVSSNHINIKFKCDADNGVEVYDLMCNKGSVKLAYSQNQNETTTDTVNISKGITITSSNDENVKFKADYDGIRILDGANNPKTKFTDKGMETDEAIIRYKEQTCGTLIQEVGEQTWFTRM